jgi:glycosyltransferase involved in cell wall biosynthesis
VTRLLIVHYTPPGVVGGVESIIHEHIRVLTQRGYQVDVVAGREANRDVSAHVLPELNVAGEEARTVDAELSDGVVSPRFWALRDRIAEDLRPLAADADVVIVHNAFTLHFNLPLTAVLWDIARTRNTGSTIAWCHDLSWVNPLYVPRMHAGFPWTLLHLPAPQVRYVVISEERRRELERLWGANETPVSVVPNGIDPARFLRLSAEVEHLAERYRLFDRDAVLLLPVRITRRKNVEAGIKAVRALVDRGRDALFLVSGPQAPHHPGLSDTYLEELQALALDLDVRDRVVFLTQDLGRTLATEEINQLYSVCDVLLFPSAQEGFGLPILEAGLARIPAVISDIPIFAEVGNGDVWRFDPQAGADTIASVIVEALDGRPSRLYRRVLARYRWDAIVGTDLLPLLEEGTGASQVLPNA